MIICDWSDDQAALEREGESRALRSLEGCGREESALIRVESTD